MYRKNQKMLVLFVLASINVLLLAGESYAEPPSVELVVNPNITDVLAGSRQIALTAKASGSNLTFEWELLGPGEFKGRTTGSAVFYVPPEKISEESEQAIISVRVSDDKAQIATDNVVLNIVAKITSTPTPPSTPSPTPESSPTIVVGDVRITQPKNGASVPSLQKVTGTYTKEVRDDIWVLVCPEQAPNKCWPQSDAAEAGTPAWKKEDGTWTVMCHFSGPRQSYEIAVYTTTSSASQFLGDTLKKWYENRDYPGIHVKNFPNGLVERDRITVKKTE